MILTKDLKCEKMREEMCERTDVVEELDPESGSL